MSKPAETALYQPVKTLLEGLGYEVKGEVGPADVVARRDEAVLVVELKTGFSLTLLQQAVARQAAADLVYVAVPRWTGKAGWRAFKGNLGLCRRLGLGVITVRLPEGRAEVHCEPAPFRPRRSPRRRAALVREFTAREGDSTSGGTRGQVMTAYRQQALRCALYLEEAGVARGAEVARETGVARATRMMADNHYGWFFRAARGHYALGAAGASALAEARAQGICAPLPDQGSKGRRVTS